MGKRVSASWPSSAAVASVFAMSTNEKRRALLTVPQAAERLAQGVSTIRRKISAGELPAIRLGTGPQAPVRIDAEELERWLEARRTDHDEEAA